MERIALQSDSSIFFGDLRQQAIRRISVACVTAKAYAIRFLQLQKHAVTFRAGVRRWLAHVSDTDSDSLILFGDFDFNLHLVRHFGRSFLSGHSFHIFCQRACQTHEQSRYFC